MKKMLIIVLTVISMLFLLTACGEQEKVAEPAGQNIPNSSEQKVVSSWQESRIALNKCFTGVTLKNNMLYGYGEKNGIVIITVCNLLSGDIIREIELLEATAVQSISVDGQGDIYVLGTTVEGYEFWKITGEGEIQLLGQIVLEDVDEEIIRQITERRLREEVKSGIQTIQYQLITLMTCNGQAPFVTMFMYLDEVQEGKKEGWHIRRKGKMSAGKFF